MRPVNLVPPEDRRGGERAPARTGPAAYVLLGALAAALGAVTLVVTTNNQISDRKAEIADLKAQEAAAQAEAQRLSDYAQFASLAQAREETVSSLARSRFDWPRVLHELAIVIPPDVTLTDIQASASANSDTGTSSSSSTGGPSGSSNLASSVAGPSLTLSGCAPSHDGVARFAAALQEIDGVTRVGVASSAKPDTSTSDGSAAAGSTCAVTESIAQFDITIAFDSVPLNPATGEPAAPPAQTPAAGAPSQSAATPVGATAGGAG